MMHQIQSTTEQLRQLLWKDPAKRLIPSKMANHPPIQMHSKTPSPTQMVCSGPLTDQMKRLKMFSLLTSTAGLFVALTVMAEMGKAGMGVVTMMASVTGIFTSVPGIFTLMTPVLIHLSVRNYVAWLKYDPAADRYTASTLMLRTRRVTLSAAEVQVPDVPGMFATFSDQGESLFADANHFQLIERFGRIMGYDRPVDLKLTSLQRADGRGGETSEAERSQRIDSHASLSRLPSALPYRGASVSVPTQ